MTTGQKIIALARRLVDATIRGGPGNRDEMMDELDRLFEEYDKK